MTQNDLLARLERATGPDRELDRDIAMACGWRCKTPDGATTLYWRRGNYSWTREDNDHPPLYTASFDAALTLVPEGWTRAVDATAPECRIDVDLFEPGSHGAQVRGTHDSEPIATCIAALKAREGAK